MQLKIIVAVVLTIPVTLAMQVPHFKVNLRHWNNNSQLMYVYSMQEQPSVEENFLEKMKPEDLKAQLLPDFHQINAQFEVTNPLIIRLISPNNSHQCLEFACRHVPHATKPCFNIMCFAKFVHKIGEYTARIFYKTFDWDTQNPPSYIAIEIDGTMSARAIERSQVSAEYEILLKEKLV